MKTTTRARIAAALCTTLLAVLGVAQPASASSSAEAELSAGYNQLTGAQTEEMSARYESLSAAMVMMYATQKGMALSEFLATEPTQSARLLGADPAVIRAQLSDNSAAELTRVMANNKLTLSTTAYSSLQMYAKALVTEMGWNADAIVAARAASWAAELAAVQSPALTVPGVPKARTDNLSVPPAGALAFGLLYDKSLTALVTDFPDIYAQVERRGLMSPEALSAWKTSMKNAYAASTQGISALTAGDPCAGTAVGAAAGVYSATGGCGGCASLGAYVNAQLQATLANPGASSTLTNPNDSTMTAAEWNRLQPWQKEAILQQNPGLAAALESAANGGSTSSLCGTGSTTLQSGARLVLPGVFDELNK